MTQKNTYPHLSDGDLANHLSEVDKHYGIRIRVALVPLARASGKSSHAVIATAYNKAGKRIHEVESTQCYFPGGTSKTFAGAAFYVVTQLVEAIDEWSVRKRREEEQFEPGTLTPLEQYIAGSF